METQTPTKDYSSNVDTSRPFGSVKEAVAIFGERLLVGEIYSPSPKPFTYSPARTAKQEIVTSSTSWRYNSPSPPKEEFLSTLKKLEAELKETKVELKLLKERESETEIALANLNAELHKNMSKLAEAEANEAKKAVMATRFDREEEKRREREMIIRMESSPTLAQILSVGEKEGYFGGKRERKMMKKKPIVPLVTDFFFKKKGSSTTFQNGFYGSPTVYFN